VNKENSKKARQMSNTKSHFITVGNVPRRLDYKDKVNKVERGELVCALLHLKTAMLPKTCFLFIYKWNLKSVKCARKKLSEYIHSHIHTHNYTLKATM